MKVTQITPNQLEIHVDDSIFFQSYDTVIAKVDKDSGELTLDEEKWNYSKTTSRYRNGFTGLSTSETKAGIDNGTIKLEDLNVD